MPGSNKYRRCQNSTASKRKYAPLRADIAMIDMRGEWGFDFSCYIALLREVADWLLNSTLYFNDMVYILP